MLAFIEHRGPDEMGYVLADDSGLGTARLSIIDIAHGQQPLGSADERYWISYNGEVYNYVELRDELEALGVRFVTRTDTEVVLQAWIRWGEQGLARLNGGFAFAIYDNLERKLVLVRDRFGKRPLYVARHRGGLLFASEMKCFLGWEDFGFRFDKSAVEDTFTFWTPLPRQTPFAGIEQVPPGHAWVVTDDGVSERAYASPSFGGAAFDGTEAEAIEHTRELLTDAVRLRLRSDVEVATYLSGGLDSAITTFLAGKLSPHTLNTFSVAFEDPAFNEESWQLELSEHLNTRHRFIKVGNREIADSFADAMWHAEVPVFRTAFVPLYVLSKLVRDSGIKVVLTGEGADEAFLGYDVFREALLLVDWNQLSEAQKAERVSRLYPYLEHFKPENTRALVGVYERVLAKGANEFLAHELRFSNSGMALRLLGSAPDASLRRLAEVMGAVPDLRRWSPVERSQWLEYTTLLAGYLLSTQGDRMAMAHSVENRCPFLDYRLVDHALSLPIELRLRDRVDEKWILKRAFQDDLPAFLRTKPKQPYRAPDAQVFIGDSMPAFVESVLSRTELGKLDFVDLEFCSRFVDKVAKTRPNQISPRENQAFMLLLSLALIDRDFVRRSRKPPVVPAELFVRRIELRTRVG
jgi:asparagine synthase (glutamine-hydrolysing)